MRETIKKAWAVKAEASTFDGLSCVDYQVWYRTEKSDGTDMENMFSVYRGDPSARFWNLAQHIAGNLNNEAS